MFQSLVLVTAPAIEPITVPDAKSWARIDGTFDDTTIAHLITAARNSAEEYLRRALITQTWKLSLDLSVGTTLGEGTYDLPLMALYGSLPQTVAIPKGPLQSVTSVVTYDLSNTASTFASSNYFVDTSGQRLSLNYGCIWPPNMRPRVGCEITYVAGYGSTASAVPQAIRNGMMIHVASLYEQRGQCADAMDIPPGAKQLYNQFRLMGSRG